MDGSYYCLSDCYYVCVYTFICIKCDKLTFISMSDSSVEFLLVFSSCFCGAGVGRHLPFECLSFCCHCVTYLFHRSLYYLFPVFICMLRCSPWFSSNTTCRIFFCEVKASSALSGTRCCHGFSIVGST